MTKALTTMTKAELVMELVRVQNANDILYDDIEQLKEELEEVRNNEEELQEEAEQFKEVLKTIRALKIANERSSYGVSYAQEEAEKLLTELYELV